MSLVRAFLAISLPDSVCRLLGQLPHPVAPVRWVLPQNYHLTLKFLGDVSLAQINLLTGGLKAELATFPRFSFSLCGIGAFPNPRYPRVIWVGSAPSLALERLYQRVESHAARLGYSPEDKSLSPHLTLGRVREQITPADAHRLRAWLENPPSFDHLSVSVSSVDCYQSELRPGGPVYTRLYTIPLAPSEEVTPEHA